MRERIRVTTLSRRAAVRAPAQAKYRNEVAPEWIHDSDSENNEAVERLLKADRPQAAFFPGTMSLAS
jgi:hypothetical protein